MPTYVLAGTVGGQATVTGALRRIKILAGSISATVTFAAVKLKLWQALKGVIRAVCAVPGQLRLKWQVFTVNAVPVELIDFLDQGRKGRGFFNEAAGVGEDFIDQQ